MNLFENLQLMKESNNWEYWKMPKGYDGPFTYPNYSKEYNNDLIGYIYPPYKSNYPNIESITNYEAELLHNGDPIETKSFRDIKSAKAWLDEVVNNKYINESINSIKSINDYFDNIVEGLDNNSIDSIEDHLDTYIWYGEYDAVPIPSRYKRGDKSAFNKKVMFRFSSGDYEEANEEFEAIIPEPYSRCKLLGKVLDRKYTYNDLSKSGFIMIGSDIQEDINTDDIIEEDWQDDWVEPYVEKEPIEEINGLYIYKGINQYGDEVYYLFLEDEDPDPGYEEWQTETLELAREWASSYEDPDDSYEDDFYDDDIINEGIKEQQNNDKLAENAIGIILAGSDDWINDDEYHDFEADYDWVNDDTCMLYFRVDGQLIGSWDIDVSEIKDINILDDISAEVEAAVSGMEID